jgi:hypothetical protein
MVQDISNLMATPPNYGFFLGWGQINAPASGSFLHYNILRSTAAQDSQYTKIGTSAVDNAIALNYYYDTTPIYSTNYYFEGTAEDSNHNISFRTPSVWGIANGTQDASEGGHGTTTIPPVISNVHVSSISGMQAVVTWDTDEVSNSSVGYSTTAGPNSFGDHTKTSATVADNAAGIGQHRVILTNLNPNTPYYFRVSSKDLSGNIATDNNSAIDSTGHGYTFTTLTGPTISKVKAYPIRNTQATIIWTTDVNSDSHVTYSLNPDMSNSTTVDVADSVTGHSVTLNNLTSDTAYYYYVKSGTYCR